MKIDDRPGNSEILQFLYNTQNMMQRSKSAGRNINDLDAKIVDSLISDYESKESLILER